MTSPNIPKWIMHQSIILGDHATQNNSASNHTTELVQWRFITVAPETYSLNPQRLILLSAIRPATIVIFGSQMCLPLLAASSWEWSSCSSCFFTKLASDPEPEVVVPKRQCPESVLMLSYKMLGKWVVGVSRLYSLRSILPDNMGDYLHIGK